MEIADPMLKRATTAGVHTEAEILSEPRCWRECLQVLRRSREIDEILRENSAGRKWLFIGCGSSFYLALAAASSWTALTGLEAQAVPASELLLYPGLLIQGDSAIRPVLISRSGNTSEVLRAAEYLKCKGARGVAITCTPGQPIESLCSATVCLEPANERSTVMTRSFTSMLMGLQFLAAKLAGNSAFLEALESVAHSAQATLDGMMPLIQQFVDAHEFGDYVYLGQGPYYGVACEAALKITEMSCSYGQAFHSLEFRHGPKSIVGPETLIAFLLSEAGNIAERDLLEEVKQLGGTTLVVANRVSDPIGERSDLVLELNLPGDSAPESEYARLVAHILPGQLLGLYTGLKKDLDPDQPRNLSRAVILDER
jgi:glucosamine--fructose-6-phosphate aminotransferase (isomerizing)